MKIQIGDKGVEGGYVDFDAKEVWTDIFLSNGFRVRMKLVVASVFMGKDKQPASGIPTVQVFSTTVISVLPPIEETKEIVH